MNSARLVIDGLHHIDGLVPVDCDAPVGTRGLQFSVWGTLAAIQQATSELIGGRTLATVNGERVHIVANSVVEVDHPDSHQINVTASFIKSGDIDRYVDTKGK